MKKIFIYPLFAALAALALPSCSDDDDYQAGPEVSDTAADIYFSSSNSSLVYLNSEEVAANPDSVYTLTLQAVRHLDTDSGNVDLAAQMAALPQLTVPVVVDRASEGVSVPESLVFAAGDTLAELVVTYVHPDKGIDATFHIDDAYANPYAVHDGSLSFQLSVNVLRKLCDVTYSTSSNLYGPNTSHFAGVTSQILWNVGRNQFVWQDFVGSGINVLFSVKEASGAKFDGENLDDLYGEIILLSNKLDYYGGGYYFLVDDNGDWPSWTPAGQDDEISSFYTYDATYQYSGYSYIDFLPYTDGTLSGFFFGGFEIDGQWTMDGMGYVYFFFHFPEEE